MDEKNKTLEVKIQGLMVFALILTGLLTCGSPDVIDGVTHQLMTKCEGTQAKEIGH